MEDLLKYIIIPPEYPYSVEIIGDRLLVLVPKQINIPVDEYIINVLTKYRPSQKMVQNDHEPFMRQCKFHKHYSKWFRGLPKHKILQVEDKLRLLKISKSDPPIPEVISYILELANQNILSKENARERRRRMRAHIMQMRRSMIDNFLANNNTANQTTRISEFSDFAVPSNKEE